MGQQKSNPLCIFLTLVIQWAGGRQGIIAVEAELEGSCNIVLSLVLTTRVTAVFQCNVVPWSLAT